MPATYTRKGNYTLSTIRTLLSENSVFDSLSETAQNAIINNSVQKIASLRNSLGLDDYNFDTASAGSVFSGSFDGYVDFTKYLRFTVIEAGETHKGTLYAANTILTEESYGFTVAPTITRSTEGSDIFINVTSSGEFSGAAMVNPNNRDITWDGSDPDDIEINIAATLGVVTIEIYER